MHSMYRRQRETGHTHTHTNGKNNTTNDHTKDHPPHFTETKKQIPNTGARANSTLHK